MRTEQEMMKLILDYALQDNRVRAVGMNGSRVNGNAPRDIFQDYDIVYFVTEKESFLSDPGWVNWFGEILIMQTPEGMSLFPPELGERYTYLMQFTDGTRIDLMLAPLSFAQEYVKEDTLTVLLLDKDGIFPPLPEPDDRIHHVKRPNAACYYDCCNEFLWTACYVAKGLWRDEFLYAAYHLEQCVRAMLLQMLEWEAGFKTGFSVSAGKCRKYLKRYLPAETMRRLEQTYAAGSKEDIWKALYLCFDLFQQSGTAVGTGLGYSFPEALCENVRRYVRRIEQLPADASSI